MDDDEEEIVVSKKKSEGPPPRRKAKKIVIPRRTPSTIIPERQIIYISADKTTCAECTCFPKESPYMKPAKLNPCQVSPLTLYELAAAVVDRLNFPEAFTWTEEEVAEWMAVDVGLPEYRECILNNHINGMRLLMLEDPSKLPPINIHYFKHIQMITAKVRKLFSTEFILFTRSIGLPPRKPLTHCTWFKSRTGPNWGIRKNWSRYDILRWMKIIMPEPIYLDHWDLVWYRKPDFPKVLFGKIPKAVSQVHIPHYKPVKEVCNEYMVPRKFRLYRDIPEEEQMIWMEHRPGSPGWKDVTEKKVRVKPPKDHTPLRLMPKKINLTGLTGKNLLLARRKMNKPKFLA